MRQPAERGRLYRSEHALRTAVTAAPPEAEGPADTAADRHWPSGSQTGGEVSLAGDPRGSTPPPGGQPPPGGHAAPEGGVPPDEDAAPAEEFGSAASHSAVMALGSLVSRITGFLRTVIIAAALGSTLVGDAYTTAQWFPGMVYELLLGGILTSVLVPVLVRARRTEPGGGEAYTQRLVTLAVLALGATTVIAVAAAPLLAWVSRHDAPGLVTALSYLILPTIFFYGMAGVLMAVLNTRGHFAAPMWAPILNNLVVIFTFILYMLIYGAERITPEQMSAGRIALLGGGTLLGIVVQATGLFPALRRVGFRWRWRFDFRSLRLRELGRLGAWMFCYVTVNQAAVLVVMSLINQAGSDASAGLLVFNNVYLLLMMAHGIVGVSIIMALMPRLSAAAADGRYDDLSADLARGARTIAVVLAPIAVAYVVLALPISSTLFQWGVFDSAAAHATAPVLLFAGLTLVPFAMSQLATFAFYALPDTRTPALVNLGVVALRIGVQLGIFLIFAASFVAAGMMLGNGISYVAGALVLTGLLRRRIGRLDLQSVGRTLGKVLLSALAAAAAGWLAVRLLPGGADPSKLEAVVQLVVGGAAVIGVYVALAMVLRIHEIHELLGLVRRKLLRGS